MGKVLDHLLGRHLDVDLHKPLLDEKQGVATFWLYNLSGQMVGYQQYRPNADKRSKNDPKEGRYFTFRPKNTVGVWGVESLHLRDDLVFVTEGVFDAARLTKLGQPALAMLCNNPGTDVKNFLWSLGRVVVAVCDPDSPGMKLAKLGNVVEVMPNGSDLGDAPEELVHQLVAKYQ